MSCCVEQHLPNLFDGCKIMLQKGLSKHFQTSHSLILGSSSQPAQWQFGATYVGSKKVGPDEVRFLYSLHDAALSAFIDWPLLGCMLSYVLLATLYGNSLKIYLSFFTRLPGGIL